MTTKIPKVDDEFEYDPKTLKSIDDYRRERGQLVLQYLSNGMSERDALILTEWSYDDYKDFKDKNQRFAQVVERKKIEYKHSLIKPVSIEAQKDPKTAQWMLERQYPEEFGTSQKRRIDDNPTNPVAVIINQIQNSSTSVHMPNKVKKIIESVQKETQFMNPAPVLTKPSPAVPPATAPKGPLEAYKTPKE